MEEERKEGGRMEGDGMEGDEKYSPYRVRQPDMMGMPDG